MKSQAEIDKEKAENPDIEDENEEIIEAEISEEINDSVKK